MLTSWVYWVIEIGLLVMVGMFAMSLLVLSLHEKGGQQRR